MSRAQNEQAAGSAGHYDQVVFVEVPLPWSRDVWESKAAPQGVAELVSEATHRGRRVRAMGVVPDNAGLEDGTFDVVSYRRQDDFSPVYTRLAYRATPSEIPALIGWLLGLTEQFPERAVVDPERVERELFVCTHGSRDACCGKHGFPIYDMLRGKVGVGKDAHLKGWRVSHTGGHRFAPTLMDFPTGIVWGRLDIEKAEQLLCANDGWRNFRDNYRGWLALDAMSQHADLELFFRHGWDWFKVPRRTRVDNLDEADGSQTVIVETQDGERQKHVQAVVLKSLETVTVVPSCSAEFPKTYPQFAVLSVLEPSTSAQK